ncbi:MAG: maleylpyruvate isomerase family mycothiol-dependent enzyme [Actinomycetota bacterium]|jgi:uncharacterized protein (TIGR03083 family)|nr:maleylpyruvate isomerase family mycothiol-dependent enzyme [Actinomycetota bacterium]
MSTADTAAGTAAGGAAGPAGERVVELLAREWEVFGELMGHLSEPTWARPALPGWDVHDVLAHVVGTERMLLGTAVPEVRQEVLDAGHVKNAIARTNEAWIVTLRERSHAELLEDYVAVTSERLAALRAMTADDFAAPSWTPVGNATYERFMEVRVFDTWMHEQDVRTAVGVPGHESGPVPEQAIAEVVSALGYIVGKKIGLPPGTSVSFRLEGPVERQVHVEVGDRARVVPQLTASPDVVIALSSSVFARLAGGRAVLPEELAAVSFDGDEQLGHTIATQLAFTI